MNCKIGSSCGNSCIEKSKKCEGPLGQIAKNTLDKISSLIISVKTLFKEHKGTLAREAPAIATGLVVGSIAGPVAGSIASASVRAAITVGTKAYSKDLLEKAKVAFKNGDSLKALAKEHGVKFLNDLKDKAFQKVLSKTFVGDLAYGALAKGINKIIHVPGSGEAIAFKVRETIKSKSEKKSNG